MKKKHSCLLPVLAGLLLAGCSLAQPAVSPEQADPWVGFYVFPDGSAGGGFYENPHLEEYGTFTADTGRFGTLAFPREVLFGIEDSAGNITFPGLEGGYSLFYTEREEEYGHVHAVQSNMAPSDTPHAFRTDDEGSSVRLSGVVYCGAPAGETAWDAYENGTIWHFYEVFQAGDGRVYLTGDGTTTNGPMTHTREATAAQTENGETVQERSLAVSVEIRTAPRLTALRVTQFDEENNAVHAQQIDLQSDAPHLRCTKETAWLLIEEISAEGTKRTLLDAPADGEEPLLHNYILLDDEGFGHPAVLEIGAASASPV